MHCDFNVLKNTAKTSRLKRSSRPRFHRNQQWAWSHEDLRCVELPADSGTELSCPLTSCGGGYRSTVWDSSGTSGRQDCSSSHCMRWRQYPSGSLIRPQLSLQLRLSSRPTSFQTARFLSFAVTLVTTMRIMVLSILAPYAMRVVLWRHLEWSRQVSVGSPSGVRCLRFTRGSLLIAMKFAEALMFPICEDLPK